MILNLKHGYTTNLRNLYHYSQNLLTLSDYKLISPPFCSQIKPRDLMVSSTVSKALSPVPQSAKLCTNLTAPILLFEILLPHLLRYPALQGQHA